MLTTSRYSLKKPQTSDAPSALRTAISDNADVLDALLDGRGYAEVLTSQSTTSAGPVDLTTVGPSVTLTLPANATVEIAANVRIDMVGVAQDGKVFLDIDGSNAGQILNVNGGAGVVQYTLPGATAGTAVQSLGGILVIQGLAAGAHTFKLRYGVAGAVTANFNNRKLAVRVRPF